MTTLKVPGVTSQGPSASPGQSFRPQGLSPRRTRTLVGSLKLCPFSGAGPLPTGIRNPGEWDSDTEVPVPTEVSQEGHGTKGRRWTARKPAFSPSKTPSFITYSIFTFFKARELPCVKRRRPGPGIIKFITGVGTLTLRPRFSTQSLQIGGSLPAGEGAAR